MIFSHVLYQLSYLATCSIACKADPTVLEAVDNRIIAQQRWNGSDLEIPGRIGVGGADGI